MRARYVGPSGKDARFKYRNYVSNQNENAPVLRADKGTHSMELNITSIAFHPPHRRIIVCSEATAKLKLHILQGSLISFMTAIWNAILIACTS